MMLRESVSPNHVEEVALFGRNYKDERALEAGLVHELHDEDGFEEYARGRLDELASRDRRSFAITKAYLRSATVERIRANDAQFTDEFLDAWFSPESQQRIQELAAKLAGSTG
jgi:enoyl-CoA hydratase/carnithine racemase